MHYIAQLQNGIQRDCRTRFCSLSLFHESKPQKLLIRGRTYFKIFCFDFAEMLIKRRKLAADMACLFEVYDMENQNFLRIVHGKQILACKLFLHFTAERHA